MKKIHHEHSSYILSKNVQGVSFFWVYSIGCQTADSEFTNFEIALARCKYLSEIPQGWTYPTLRNVEGQWRIYSDSGVVFVPLDKATPELIKACDGAANRLEEENNKPF